MSILGFHRGVAGGNMAPMVHAMSDMRSGASVHAVSSNTQQPTVITTGPDTSMLDTTVDLAKFLRTLWLGKWLIMFLGLLGAVAGGYWAFRVATPLYSATSVVILETRQGQIVDFESVSGGISANFAEIASEVEVLRARTLMGAVVDELDLTTDPEFNSRLRPPGAIAQLRANIPGVPTSVRRELSPEQLRDAAVNALLGRVLIRNIPQTFVFRITVETQERAKSTLIANTIAKLYISSQIEQKFAASEQATLWLNDRVTELQGNLETAEARVRDFSRDATLVSPETLAAIERQLKDQRDRLDDLDTQTATAAQMLADLEAAPTPAEKAAVLGDPRIIDLARQAATNRNAATAVDTFIDTRTQQLRLTLSRGEEQARTLTASIRENEAQAAQQSTDLIELQQLTREADAVGVLYEYFLSRLKETSAQEGIQSADSRILSEAVMPGGPSSPNKRLAVVVLGALGGLIGVALVLWKEARNTSFRDIGELEHTTSYPVIGYVPHVRIRRRKALLQYLVDKPSSAFVESIRNWRTTLLLPRDGVPPQVIMSTSSVPAEGKTTNSLSLTQNITGIGRSVLLIEGDIRRQTLSAYFDIDHTGRPGIVSAANGDVPFEDIVYHDPLIKADVVFGEPLKANAADFFASANFEKFLKDMRERYDYIVIDTPPTLLVPDPRIIARHCDAVVVSVHWNKTTRRQVQETLRMFESVGQKVTGLVLSRVNQKASRAYGYDSYTTYKGNNYYTN